MTTPFFAEPFPKVPKWFYVIVITLIVLYIIYK